MGNRKFSFTPGEYFHVYNRGNSKQKIFFDKSDYYRFIALLFVVNSTKPFKFLFLKDPYVFDRGEQIVSIGAYCLMPNHYHLLLMPRTETGLSKFMQRLSTGYSMYFNNKYDRTGALFEGRFKAELATNDEYLKYLYAYIHLNPVKLIQSDWKETGILDKEKAKKYISKYPYSSFQHYAGKTKKLTQTINQEDFPKYFQDKNVFEEQMFDWLHTKLQY